MRGWVILLMYFTGRPCATPAIVRPVSAEWEARVLVESSLAIKCPNIALHLCGTKKVQQVRHRSVIW